MELFARLYDELTDFPKPTVAVCHGACVGGGVSTESPLGAALVGARVGDSVQVQAPKGAWTARVVSVRSA